MQLQTRNNVDILFCELQSDFSSTFNLQLFLKASVFQKQLVICIATLAVSTLREKLKTVRPIMFLS